MSGAHSPGPWRVDEGSLHAYFTDSISVIGRDGGAVCCTTRGGFHDPNTGERAPAWPDARLIAAAPELLKALHSMLAAQLSEIPAFEAGKEAQDAWASERVSARNEARAAIRKADGT